MSGVRSLAESALLAAITVLLMFLGTFLPIAGFFIVLMWPIPIMLVIQRHGIRYGLMAVAVTVILAAMFLGVLQAVFAGVTVVGLIGVVFGIGLRRGWKGPTLLGAGTAAIAVSLLAALSIFAPLMGINLMEQIQTMTVESLDMMVEMYSSMGMDRAGLEETRLQFEQAVDMMRAVFPGMLMLSSFLYALWTLAMTRWTLPRLGYEVPALPPFGQWRAPIWMALFLMASYMVLAILPADRSTYWHVLANNVMFVTNAAYVVFGAALLFYFLRRAFPAPWMAGILTALLAFNTFGMLILPLAAIVDSGMDFRKRFQSSPKT